MRYGMRGSWEMLGDGLSHVSYLYSKGRELGRSAINSNFTSSDDICDLGSTRRLFRLRASRLNRVWLENNRMGG